jgi:subtilisin family serine protease
MNSKTHQYHFRATYLRWYFIVGTLALLSMLSPAQAQLDVPAGVLNNVKTGKARIIVTLKMPERPDGDLSGTMTVDDQRAQIKQKQWEFLRGVYPTLEGDISGSLDIPEVHPFRTIPAVAMEVNSDTLAKIRGNDEVESVEEDVPHPPTLSDSIPLIGADSVWQLGHSGAGQTVVILDTGVDGDHQDLVGKVVAEACYSTTSTSYNATSLCPNGAEEQTGSGTGVACDSGVSGCDHGTHVAGIVAANGSSLKGVAKDASIIAIQVFSRFDNPTYCGSSKPCALSFTSAQIKALEHVLELYENGMDIVAVNMSLGGGNHSEACSGAIEGPIDNLRSVGIVTIAASGNDGYKDGIASPACISSAISVGATTKSDTIADYSNSADILDLLAPGSYIESTLLGGSTGLKSGTSMAAPHVAGAVALLKSAAPDVSTDDILKVLKNTGKRIEDNRIGIPNPPRITPRINLKKALERLLPDEPPPATPDISVTPTSHDFGNVEVGQSSRITVTVSNIGDGDLEIEQLALTGADFIISNDGCSNTTVVAGGNCTVKVTFNPQTEGAKNATLSIPSNDSDTPTVTLNGNGILVGLLEPNISVIPTDKDFGDVKVNGSSNATVTVSNTGDDDLVIEQLVLTGGDFTISTDNCSNTTVVPDGSCTVTITFTPQIEGAKSATLSIASNDPDTPTVEITLSGNGIVEVVEPTPAPASPCLIYAVHDQGRNNSQIFTISLDATHEVNPLGPMYSGYDLESIAIQPTSNIIYVASGEDVASGQKKGSIYTVDSTNGALSLVCNTGVNEIEDLAFSADGETLWAWAKGDGLITIDLTTITTVPITGEPTCDTDLVIPSNAQVEGLTLKEGNGTIIFYGAVNTSLELWEYNSSTSDLDICSLPSETEALEIMSDGTLLFGTHNDSSFSVHAFDPDACDELVAQDIPTGKYNDVEGIALSTEECVK